MESTKRSDWMGQKQNSTVIINYFLWAEHKLPQFIRCAQLGVSCSKRKNNNYLLLNRNVWKNSDLRKQIQHQQLGNSAPSHFSPPSQPHHHRQHQNSLILYKIKNSWIAILAELHKTWRKISYWVTLLDVRSLPHQKSIDISIFLLRLWSVRSLPLALRTTFRFLLNIKTSLHHLPGLGGFNQSVDPQQTL